MLEGRRHESDEQDLGYEIRHKRTCTFRVRVPTLLSVWIRVPVTSIEGVKKRHCSFTCARANPCDRSPTNAHSSPHGQPVRDIRTEAIDRRTTRLGRHHLHLPTPYPSPPRRPYLPSTPSAPATPATPVAPPTRSSSHHLTPVHSIRQPSSDAAARNSNPRTPRPRSLGGRAQRTSQYGRTRSIDG